MLGEFADEGGVQRGEAGGPDHRMLLSHASLRRRGPGTANGTANGNASRRREGGSSRRDATLLEDEAPIGLPVPLAQQVRGDQDGGAAARRRVQLGVQEAAPVGVEAEAGLVEHQDRCVRQRLDGQREALARAAGEAAGRLAAHVGQAPPLLGPVDPLAIDRPRSRA